MWGLWESALAGANLDDVFIDLLADEELEVRAWAAQILGDTGAIAAEESLIDATSDPEPRVAFFAACALRKMPQSKTAQKALANLLRENDNVNPYLRHAAVVGLAGQSTAKSLNALRRDRSPAVRLGALLALRRMKDGDIGRSPS